MYLYFLADFYSSRVVFDDDFTFQICFLAENDFKIDACLFVRAEKTNEASQRSIGGQRFSISFLVLIELPNW